ncbi:SRPBCC domain-containing protein [Candidatus Neptunichlamydia sp. REUL1]|uniref:SRPBCC domain-containing protein n=1 Tax=Candidatus Neptunichlamydia sp. REUL1 TaxID=3064277 RepID=UPI00292F4E8A|nr:SRPBCC domain-containing protein [Candidatus Neptunochlamydia sp. REUL1]
MDIEVSHTEFTKASPQDVWFFWSNPDTWSQWDTGIEWCKLNEGSTFSAEGKATLLPKGAPYPIEITITDCVPNEYFIDQGQTPLGTIILSHQIVVIDSGVNVTHKMKFIPKDQKSKKAFESGLLKKMQKELPEAVRLLVKLVEQNEKIESS